MTVTITLETAPGYLAQNGVLHHPDDATARVLGGGVSNRVVQVRGEEGCYVLKQPLSNLDVEDDWPADLVRIHNEAAAARAYAGILEGVPRTAVPSVVFEDETDHVAVFECAPASAVTWKRRLLDGSVNPGVAALVGDALGRVHAAASGDETLRAEFDDDAPFDQLRIDPYHLTVAERHPAVADRIREEVRRIRRVDRTLVHGDYSPKNVLVTDDDDPDVWLLDFEVAHWGDPAFDAAFMLNHLFIKSVHNADAHVDYVAAARRFWDRYRERVPWDVESETTVELAILLLARVDGKSPVEYVDDATADALRSIALEAIRTGTEEFDEFAALVAAEVDR